MLLYVTKMAEERRRVMGNVNYLFKRYLNDWEVSINTPRHYEISRMKLNK